MDRKTREALETFASAVKKKLKEKFWKEHFVPAEDFAREKGYRRGIMDDVFMILDLARIQGWCETGAILWHSTDDEPCYESKTDFWAYADELLPSRDGGCKDPQFLRYPVLQHKV